MIAVTPLPLKSLESDHRDLAVFVYEDAGLAGAKALSTAAKAALNGKLHEEGFKAGAKEVCRVDLDILGKHRRVFAVGLGKKKGATSENFRRAAGSLSGAVRSKREKIAVLCSENPQAIAEGLLLASYKYEEYKKGDVDKLTSAAIVIQDAGSRGATEKACAKAATYASAVSFARDLVNRGPSDKTPQSLADLAETFKGSGVSVTVMDKAALTEAGMGGLLGVARGSHHPPVMVHMIYKPKAATKKRVAIVGKGVTFDSGGLSIKPAASMEEMKCDMAGAASVLAVFKVIAELKPKIEVHGIFASTYNLTGPDAYMPGDVLKAMNGKTIEVWNTDAEGRLILADALCLAAKQEPMAIVDLATLTGAVVVALGSKVAGIMGNDAKLISQLKAAGKRADEAFCELPLVEDYKENIKGNIAELLNISKARGEAGSIIGGLFLQEFVDGKPWVHLDIAGTAFTSGESATYAPKGATGSPVRTLLEWLGALWAPIKNTVNGTRPIDLTRIESHMRDILGDLGEDPKREGLLATPHRVAKSLRDLTSGYHVDIDAMINKALFTECYDEMVIVRDIAFYSMCEHHMLPFFGRAHVAYLPNKKIIGLSKIPKIVEVFSRRLQVQERLTRQIADTLNDKLKPRGVGVIMEARHLCMEMRGAESQHSPTTTSCMLGVFQSDARTRKEFLELVKTRPV